MRRWRFLWLFLVVLTGCQPDNRLNFLLISMDTMRGDHVGKASFHSDSLTPVLDDLAARGTMFTRAYSQSNETLFSHSSMFTSQYPSHWGELKYETYRMKYETPTIAAQLARQGYRNQAVVAGGHLNPVFGVSAGFHQYQSMGEFSSFQQTVPVAIEQLEKLAKGRKPFLLFVHGYDCHTPYVKPGVGYRIESPDYHGEMLALAPQPLTYERIFHDRYYPSFYPPEKKSEDGVTFLDTSMFRAIEQLSTKEGVKEQQLTPEDIEFLLGSYRAAVAYADMFVGFLLDELERQGLMDNTVVIVFGDHGEDLLAHGYFNHRYSLHDENIHVPLIIAGPNVPQQQIDEPVALLDIAPTIARLTNTHMKDGIGQDLLAAKNDRIVFSESMLGEYSARNQAARLLIHGNDLVEHLPAKPPASWSLLDDNGEQLSWEHPQNKLLWNSLQREFRP